ncbi:MAG: membrane dipeptidase [Flavobacterium sp.]|nr:membrane dipeptidase [Flavobacterium sp.]
MSSKPVIDIHVHSSLKPYGNSFNPGLDSSDQKEPSCIWHEDKANWKDRLDENALGVARYRQSDCTSLVQGMHHIACVSLYPMEVGFVQLQKYPLQLRRKAIINFVTMLGKKRIEHIESDGYNYFNDFKKELHYLMTMDGKVPNHGDHKYSMVVPENELDTQSDLLIIPTVEGGHFLCNGHDTENKANWDNTTNWKELSTRVLYVKNQPSPLFFVTLAHHFYNGLCTHAKSLFGIIEKVLDQKHGMDDYDHPSDLEPITPLGEKVIELLLSTNNGQRILIDVKHMSKNARNRYYGILASDQYKDEKIPIIYSHGACDFTEKTQINLNQRDVLEIYKSNGIIGIEIDQRILGFKKDSSRNQNKAFFDSKSFWKQIITIAELAYDNDFDNPWQCIALGSDYDGIINPLNSFRDASSVGELRDNLIQHLNDYWSTNSKIPKNYKGNSSEIIHQIMYQNAFNFIQKHYLRLNEIA